MIDLAALQPIADRVIGKAFSAGVAALSEGDRVFFLLWSYPIAVDDGGFASFFYNSFADHYADTVNALRTVGLADHAQLLERAAGILFNSDVPGTTDARNAAMDQLSEEVGTDEDLDELYRGYTAAGGSDRVLETLERWYFEPAE